MLSWHAMIHGVYGQVQLQLENMCYLSSAAEPVVPSFPPENRWSGVVRKLGIPKNLVVKSFTPSLSSRRCLQVFISCFYLTSCDKKKNCNFGRNQSPAITSHHQPSPAITSHHQPWPLPDASALSPPAPLPGPKIFSSSSASAVAAPVSSSGWDQVFPAPWKMRVEGWKKKTDGIWWRSEMRIDESQSMWWNVGDNRKLACSKLDVTILIHAELQVVSLTMSK